MNYSVCVRVRVQNLQIDYDRQTEQLDKEREKAEAAEKQIAELTKRLSGAVTQVVQQTHTQTPAAHTHTTANKLTHPLPTLPSPTHTHTH